MLQGTDLECDEQMPQESGLIPPILLKSLILHHVLQNLMVYKCCLACGYHKHPQLV